MSIVPSHRTSVERVPYDIWYTILKACDCLPSFTGFEDPGLIDRYRTHTTLVAVSHVCKYLRTFVLSAPLLWTRISLRIGDSPPHDMGTPHIQLMQLFLERSRDMPLHVTLSVGRFDFAKQQEEHQFLMELFAEARRWKQAALELDVEWIDQGVWEEWRNSIAQHLAPVGLLESLEVRVSVTEDIADLGRPYVQRLKLPVELWTASPSLTQLAISVRELDPLPELESLGIVSSDFMGWTMQSRIPFSQITHLLLEGGPSTHISWPDIGGIFRAAPNLIVCFLEGICAEPRHTPSPSPPVVLQHLMHLYIEASCLDGLFESLTPGLNRVLTAPALKTLALVYGEGRAGNDAVPDSEEWEQEPYTNFITRSSCSLDELRLIGLNIPIGQLLLCMHLSPTLKVLHTDFDMTWVVQFSGRMQERQSQHNTPGSSGQVNNFLLCPHLEELGIYNWDQFDICDMFGGSGTPDTRLLAFPQDGVTASSTTHKINVVGLPDPYYVENAHDQIHAAIDAFSPTVRHSERMLIIYQYYLVLHTIRRSLWNRFRYEK